MPPFGPRNLPRRALQFSLRGLLMLLLVTFTCLGYYADRVHRQREAAAQIRKLGGDPLLRSSTDTSVLKLRLARWLGPHAVYTISDVSLGGCALGNDDLGCLAGLPNLRTLTLTSTPITDEGLVHLSGLNHLRFVDLRFTGVTAAGIERLRRCLPHTRIIYRSDID